jgi:hypothetical protein
VVSTSRPRIATGVALLTAGLIAVSPAALSLLDLQHRLVRLTTVEAGEINFPEVDWNDFVANTTANWNGLVDMYDHTTAIYSLPDAVYTQGLTQVFNDLSTDVQELAKYSAALSTYDAAVAAQNGELDPTGTLPPIPTFPDLYNDPVLNPLSALTLLLQNGIASDFGENALQVGLTGIYQNMLPSINDINTEFSGISTQLENLFTGGSFSTTPTFRLSPPPIFHPSAPSTLRWTIHTTFPTSPILEFPLTPGTSGKTRWRFWPALPAWPPR